MKERVKQGEKKQFKSYTILWDLFGENKPHSPCNSHKNVGKSAKDNQPQDADNPWHLTKKMYGIGHPVKADKSGGELANPYPC